MTQHADGFVEVRQDGPVAYITLNRPESLNALSLETLTAVRSAAQELSTSDCRSIVLHGNGSAFSSGVDLETLRSGLIEQADPELRYDAARLGKDVVETLAAVPQVTVAALHGHVVGGGLVLAAACDLRIADHSAVFSIPEIDLGIPLGWSGIPCLVAEIGPMRTKDLVMTGRVFSADDAMTYGLLTAVVADGTSLEEAERLARIVASKARFPITMTKRHVAEILAGDDSRDDALGLVASIEDPEATARRQAYLDSFGS